MYRYLLFYYDDFYPYGGMEDCVLKTTLFEELEKFIHENYEGDYYAGTISYYDTVEDKTMYANMEVYDNKDFVPRLRFLGWEEN